MKYEELYAAFTAGKRLTAKDVPLEKYFQKRITDYLNTLPDCFCWKAQAGAYCQSGLPDVCCVYKGKFFAFEVKRPFGIGRLTLLQQQVINKINAAGGRAYIVSFVEEVKERIMTDGCIDGEL